MTFFQTISILLALSLGLYAAMLLTIISARLQTVINAIKALGAIEMVRAGVELRAPENQNAPTPTNDATKH